jgi:cytochrome c peroxidase
MKFKLLAISVSTLLLSACGSGAVVEEPIQPTTPAPVQLTDFELDVIELQKTLAEASPNGSIEDYILPESDDYFNIPQDPLNPITESKVKLGKMLYHETGMTVSLDSDMHEDTFSCASCHNAQSGFKSGIKQGVGDGGVGFASNRFAMNPDIADVQPVSSPTTMNVAYQEAMLWNGQFGNQIDGTVNVGIDESILSTEGTPKVHNAKQWSGIEVQAIAGLGVHRLNTGEDSPIATVPEYQELVAEIGEDDLLVAAALAIAAYERTILSSRSPFQSFVKGDTNALGHAEVNGAKLFFGKAGCGACHNGPALSSPQFATESEMFMAIGFGDLDMNEGIVGEVSDAVRKGRGGFTGEEEDMYAFKVPSLYNLTDTNVFGHGSTFTSVREVVEYKNAAVPQADIPEEYLDSRFVPLNLTPKEVDELVSFLEGGLYDADLMRYVPETLPSGNCVTNADLLSRSETGCDL